MKIETKTKVVALSIMLICLVANVFAKEAVSYNDYVANAESSELVSLATELHPSIYLNDGVYKEFGNGAAKVLNTDVASIPMLYEENGAFSEVELIRINIRSAADEAAKINLEQLTAFENLKYVLFVYQYDVCGDNGDSCLKAKTDEKAATAESDIQVLYLLSIPN